MFKGIGFRVLGMSLAYTQDLQGFPFVRRFQMSAAGFSSRTFEGPINPKSYSGKEPLKVPSTLNPLTPNP